MDIKDTANIRKVTKLGENTPAISIPKSFGLKTGDFVLFEKIDETCFKVMKLDVKLQQSTEI